MFVVLVQRGSTAEGQYRALSPFTGGGAIAENFAGKVEVLAA